MYNIEEIKDLIKAVDDSGISELEVTGEANTGLVIRKKPDGVMQQVAVPATQEAAPPISAENTQPLAQEGSDQQQAPSDPNVEQITSPMVGTFYRAPSPDAESYVHPGDRINESSVVCIVEAMKLMNEIEAEIEGEIKEILVENGELVDYGQPLFLVKK
ncbi:acetyl-CoA carboxylase biotin carboxyl carrier protein [Salicibibacter halophilus]|uniref:Biotin carboxyl carrier protein of acetyl-CoA carboxylase n=1 Tax=Salicibibacter halophilus TaxID=2502791 RepID=A0A514LGJ4_9BACI|nr:acetyl-CoA carboxylase biotin carboxyl carrier protein [Salicibibacter halophilus]QDI90966.1 acetyl-CoA carboxylase biotin carboxyl carrier protein [Salicibibacter halophilus]